MINIMIIILAVPFVILLIYNFIVSYIDDKKFWKSIDAMQKRHDKKFSQILTKFFE